MGHILQIAEANGMVPNAGDAEVVQFGAGGQHQITPRQSIGRGSGQLLVGEVDLADAVLYPADSPAAEQLPVGRSHLPRLHFAAQQLVQKGLEVEMLLGLNQHHGTVGQPCGDRQGTEQPAETTPHDHHSLGWW